jgi:hypothetical protein
MTSFSGATKNPNVRLKTRSDLVEWLEWARSIKSWCRRKAGLAS